VYQREGGVRRSVEGGYIVKSNGRVAFQIAQYDHDRPLLIDPVLSYSTYLGGGGQDGASGIAIDGTGNVYIAGHTNSCDFPLANKWNCSGNGGAFVAKLDTSGSTLLFSTYLYGGTIGGTKSPAIAVDSFGNVYLTGGASFPDYFPRFNGLPASYGDCLYDAFVAKLNSTGSLLYSTCLGGATGSQTFASAIAVDTAGNAYIAGQTESPDFPTTVNAAQRNYGSGVWGDAFVAKLSADGSALLYSTFLGGSGNDAANGIAVDLSGNAYVVGDTVSSDFPVANAFQPKKVSSSTQNTAFVSKLNASGSALLYSTFLGGTSSDWAEGVAVDSAGNAYVTGHTQSKDFPQVNALQPTNAGQEDIFVAKLDPAGAHLLYSTYLGGSGVDRGLAIALDATRAAYITGSTGSRNFPLSNPFRRSYGGNSTDNGYLAGDAFVTKLNPSGSALMYSSYLGGGSDDGGIGIAVSPSGIAYVTGTTYSGFPTQNALQSQYGGGYSDAWVARISPSELTVRLTVGDKSSNTVIVSVGSK